MKTVRPEKTPDHIVKMLKERDKAIERNKKIDAFFDKLERIHWSIWFVFWFLVYRYLIKPFLW